MSDNPGDGVRLLTIMGSGETSPTMVKVHRSILERLGASPIAVLLDTPFGFQENAAELAARVVAYFRESLHTQISVASVPAVAGRTAAPGATPRDTIDRGATRAPRAGDWSSFADEQLMSHLRSAGYVFSGPGSPTYALEQWRDSVVPQLLAEKLDHGGVITFASAAALTLGVSTVPVYEIYKVGEAPHWVSGLDLLSRIDIEAAVIPHFNNAEGGTHDTRFCYLGERRLALMEQQLPAGAFVLGVDEHTALTLDVDARSAVVAGLGSVTIRRGRSHVVFPTGTEISIDEMMSAGRAVSGGNASGHRSSVSDTTDSSETGVPSLVAPEASHHDSGESPLVALVRELESRFSAATESRQVPEAVGALVELEGALIDWSKDIPGGDTLDRARMSFRSMLVELGKLAVSGVQDRREIVGPFVDAIISLRRRARESGRYDESDEIRDTLRMLGVEVRDTADGIEWLLVAENEAG